MLNLELNLYQKVQLTIDGVDKEKVLENFQKIRNSSTKPAESKATNDLN